MRSAHIAANHAHARQAYAQRSNVFGVLGAILGGDFRRRARQCRLPDGAAAVAASTLSFSREQEYQADTLGIRYLVAAGYDPAGGPGILAALTRANRAPGPGPGTDQSPDSRMGEHAPAEREPRATRAGRGPGNRPARLRNAQSRPVPQPDGGLYVDDDPAQGVIEGATFTHPDLRIQFTVPPGYLMQNGTDAVTVSGIGGEGAVQRRPLQRQPREYDPAGLSAADRRAVAAGGPAAAADHGQRHAGGLHHGARQHRSGVVDASVVRLSMGSGHGLSFRHANAGRLRHPAVRGDGQFAAPDHAGGGGRDPAAHHPCRDGGSGRHGTVAGKPDGLPRFQARAVCFAQRPGRERQADARARKSSSWCTDRAG